MSAADHDFVAELLRDKGKAGHSFYMVVARKVPTEVVRVKTTISKPVDGSPLGVKLIDYANVGPTKGMRGTYVGDVTHGSPAYVGSFFIITLALLFITCLGFARFFRAYFC